MGTCVPVPAVFYTHRCESPVKSTHQVGRFYHMTFQIALSMESGNKVEVPHRRDRRKQIARRRVCINRWGKSLAIIAGDQIGRDRRTNKKKIARRVAGLRLLRGTSINARKKKHIHARKTKNKKTTTTAPKNN